MITDIKKFEIYNNRYAIIHALIEESGEQVLYETRFKCGEETDYDFEELAALPYSKESFEYIENLNLDWTPIEN
jgi:hypothetical protein